MTTTTTTAQEELNELRWSLEAVRAERVRIGERLLELADEERALAAEIERREARRK